MFLKKSLHKDRLKRIAFKDRELDLLLLKFIYKNEFLATKIRLLAFNLYIRLKPRATQINNLCLATGRSRSVIGDYKISRIVFRNYCEKGHLIGIYKK